MEYKGMKEDERLISVTPSKRQIDYQNIDMVIFVLRRQEQLHCMIFFLITNTD